MSIQEDIETALAALVEAAISGMATVVGPVSQPEIEGNDRRACIFQQSSAVDRLEWGQNDITDTFRLVLWWSATIDRETRLDEFQALTDALIADQYLTSALAVLGVRDVYLSSSDWGEAIESNLVSMDASIEVRRME